MNVTLRYVEGGVDYERTFDALILKGFYPADHHVQFPNLRPEYLDGTVRKKQAGFRRVFTLDMGVLVEVADLNYLGKFLASEAQYIASITYGSTTETDLRVVDRGGQEFVSEWLEGIEVGRNVIIDLEEAAIRSTYPSGTPTAEPIDTVYFKKRVQITGTPTSPQTLTFGSGALATTESGGSFPTINNVTHVYRVDVDAGPYQEARVYMASTPSLNGSNYVTFTIAHSEAGNAAADGNHYADITLTVQTI